MKVGNLPFQLPIGLVLAITIVSREKVRVPANAASGTLLLIPVLIPKDSGPDLRNNTK